MGRILNTFITTTAFATTTVKASSWTAKGAGGDSFSSFPPSPHPAFPDNNHQAILNGGFSSNGLGRGFGDNNIDIITGSQFHGLKTYANLPYVNCFADSEVEKAGLPYDIAVIGAPFDTATTGRPGARYGPGAIRTGSQRIHPQQAYSVYTGKNPLDDWASVVDCGDVPMTWLDNRAALAQLDKAHRVVSGRESAAAAAATGGGRRRGGVGEHHSKTPRILTLGGDHTTTLSALRSTYERWGKVSVVHFDSHIDTWDPMVIGGGISDYAGLNHGTFLHIAHEEGLIHNTSIHAGIRAPVGPAGRDMRNDRRCGFSTITARDIDYHHHRNKDGVVGGGISGIVDRIRERVKGSLVYVSVDIDVLDPAFAPATGTAEPGGWSTRELLSILGGLRDTAADDEEDTEGGGGGGNEGFHIVGADVVEVSPAYDNTGETTALAAAEVALALLEIMVENPVRSLADRGEEAEKEL